MSLFKFINSNKKIIGRGLIILLLVPIMFFSIPGKTEALVGKMFVTEIGPSGWSAIAHAISGGVTAGATTANAVNSTAYNIKEFIAKPLAVLFAKNILRGITAQTVTWINTGFKGNPAYLTDPEQFFLSQADNIASTFLTIVTPRLCSPFRAQVRLALVQNYMQETAPQGICTLGGIERNFNNFTNDFEQGGWDSWFMVTQNSNNNPYGSYQNAKNTLSAQIGNKQVLKNKELDQGGGFLSFKKCAKRGNVARRTLEVTRRGICEKIIPFGEPGGGTCLKYGPDIKEGEDGEVVDEDVCLKEETVTPGSVIGAQLNKVVSSPVLQLELVNDVNQIVGALMQQLFESVLGGIGGLRGTSQPNSAASGSRSLLMQMASSSPESREENTEQDADINEGIPENIQPVLPGEEPYVYFSPPTDEEIRADIDAFNQKYGDTSNPPDTSPDSDIIVP